MTAFELSSATSFYYSIDFPNRETLSRMQSICFEQFRATMNTMETVELCKCLKYVGGAVWEDKELTDRVLSMFEESANEVAYNDIMAVVAILMLSGKKSERVVKLLSKLIDRKKRLESLRLYGTTELEEDYKKDSKILKMLH
jgi:hypothetical protein